MIQYHALTQQFRKGFRKLDQAQILHHARPEARIEQMQHRVLNPTDVLIHRHPVVVASINHRLIVAGRGVTHEVPRRIDKRIHRVGFTPGRFAAAGALARQKRLVFG